MRKYEIIPELTLNGIIAKHKREDFPKVVLLKEIESFQNYLANAVAYYNHMADGIKEDCALKYHYRLKAKVYNRVLTGEPEE